MKSYNKINLEPSFTTYENFRIIEYLNIHGLERVFIKQSIFAHQGR